MLLRLPFQAHLLTEPFHVRVRQPPTNLNILACAVMNGELCTLSRRTFPALLSLPELRDVAAVRPATSGAVEALLFLNTHVSKCVG